MGECCYRNDSSKMVIFKCIGENQFFCEKVLMPSELYFFDAPNEARLEIWLLHSGEPMLHTTAEARDYALLTHRKLGDP